MRISDWSSDVCSSDLSPASQAARASGAAISIRRVELCILFLLRKVWTVWSGDAASTDRRREARTSTAADRLCSRSEEHTSELQSLMRISYAVFCIKKKIYRTALQTTTPCVRTQPLISNNN